MSIVTIDQITSPYVYSYLNAGTVNESLYFERADGYYNSLLVQYGINTDYIPAELDVSTNVKYALVMYTNILVARDKLEISLQQLNQGVIADPWKERLNEWEDALAEILKSLTTDDFYDPNNPPPEDEETIKNPMIKEWFRA